MQPTTPLSIVEVPRYSRSLHLAASRDAGRYATHHASTPNTFDCSTTGPTAIVWEGEEEWPIAAYAVAWEHPEDPHAEETVLVDAELDYRAGPPLPYTLVRSTDYCPATLRVRIDPPVVSYLAVREWLLAIGKMLPHTQPVEGAEETGEGAAT